MSDQKRQGKNHRVQALFEAAIELPASAQAAFLNRACGGDVALEKRLLALLAAANRPSAMYVNPAALLLDSTDQRTGAADETVVSHGLTHSVTEKQSHSPTDPRDRSAFRPGARIDHYELIREIGRGGMGAVYLARDLKLGRRVAMKFLQSDRPTFTERFIAEAKHTARCNHEHIVVIHDVDEYRGNPFMVLEYLRGQTLRKLMAKGTVSATRAAQLMIPVVRALAFAHAQQIIHRDLKPDNIFVTDAGTIKVLDFGIAKYMFDNSASDAIDPASPTAEAMHRHPELTRQGAIIGTLPYMSPEQWGVDTVDFRSDLWAVGIMLYLLVVGKHPLHPLRGEQFAVTAIVEQPMPSAHDAPVKMPAALADIIDGCLKKHKHERLASADVLLGALSQLLPEHKNGVRNGHESPYAGLTAFQEADASRFFGRARDIATLYARLQDEPLIGVVGPSGVGKSSFVRAGVIPALKHSGDQWESFVIRPGRQPVAALARLIATILGDDSDEATWHAEDLNRHYDIIRRLTHEPGYLGAILRDRARKHQRRILLFLDQFEELYTLTPELQDRLTFSNAIAAVADDATSPLRVVLAIRSDFLDRVAEDRQFMTELHRALYFLVQPDRAGLREAIVRPAEMAGYLFEAPSIVGRMLDQLEATTGALPLLQFAATKLWENRNAAHKLLTERSYRDLGGVEGALASHANTVLSSLTPQEQTLVRAIFLQLVTPDRTRAITPVAELRELWHEPDVVQRLVDVLVDARLLVTSTGDVDAGALVEIVHESLIHSWPMLSHWLDENQEDAPLLAQLRAAAKQWHERGRPSGLLWRGDAAREAEAWSRRYRGLLPRLHREYLDAVFALAARTARRKRMLLIGTIAFLVLLVLAATIGLVMVRNAEQETRLALLKLQAEIEAKRRAESAAKDLAGQVGQEQEKVQSARDKLAEANEQLRNTNASLRVSLNSEKRAKHKAEAESTKARKAEEWARMARGIAERARDEAELARVALAVKLNEEQRRLQTAEQRVKALEKVVGPIVDALQD